MKNRRKRQRTAYFLAAGYEKNDCCERSGTMVFRSSNEKSGGKSIACYATDETYKSLQKVALKKQQTAGISESTHGVFIKTSFIEHPYTLYIEIFAVLLLRIHRFCDYREPMGAAQPLFFRNN